MWLEEEIFSNWGKISSSTVFGFFSFISGIWLLGTIWRIRCYVPLAISLTPPLQLLLPPFSPGITSWDILRPFHMQSFVKGICFSLLKIHIFFFFFPHSKIHIFSSDPSYSCFIISAFPLNLASENVKEQCKSPTVWFKVVFPTYKKVILRINCKIAVWFHSLWVYCSYTSKSKKANT